LTVLTTKAAKLVTLVAGQTGASAAAIAIRLLNPPMDGRHAWLKFAGETLRTATRPGQ
jgi:hypothetical protein